MDTIDHNPFTWFSTASAKQRDKNYSDIRNDRAQDGFSWWDLVNFDDFYITAIRKVADNYAAGNIPRRDALDAVFEKIDFGIMYIIDLKERTTSTENDDERHDLKNAGHEVILDIVRMFFEEALPELPFAEGEYAPSRVSREDILAKEDMPVIGSHMKYVFVEGIARYAASTHGYPAGMEDFEEWENVLNMIKEGVSNIAPHKKMGGAALDLLIEHYPSLWD